MHVVTSRLHAENTYFSMAAEEKHSKSRGLVLHYSMCVSSFFKEEIPANSALWSSHLNFTHHRVELWCRNIEKYCLQRQNHLQSSTLPGSYFSTCIRVIWVTEILWHQLSGNTWRLIHTIPHGNALPDISLCWCQFWPCDALQVKYKESIQHLTKAQQEK